MPQQMPTTNRRGISPTASPLFFVSQQIFWGLPPIPSSLPPVSRFLSNPPLLLSSLLSHSPLPPCFLLLERSMTPLGSVPN
ncbi:unnamed protein product [Ixodes pacificus]